MEKSPSWEATTQLWDPKFHYLVHKSPPLVAILAR